MKQITYDKPRIVSTIILGVILTLLTILALLFVGVTWADIDAAAKSASEGAESPEGGVVAGIASAFALSLVIVLIIMVYIGVIIGCGICSIFTIKNRKSTLKPIRIISYVMDGIAGSVALLSIVKIILYFCGV